MSDDIFPRGNPAIPTAQRIGAPAVDDDFAKLATWYDDVDEETRAEEAMVNPAPDAIERARQLWSTLLACSWYPCPEPVVAPGPDASVDLHWHRTESGRHLLINVEPEPGGITYFGNEPAVSGTTIAGMIDLAGRNWWVVAWLMGS